MSSQLLKIEKSLSKMESIGDLSVKLKGHVADLHFTYNDGTSQTYRDIRVSALSPLGLTTVGNKMFKLNLKFNHNVNQPLVMLN